MLPGRDAKGILRGAENSGREKSDFSVSVWVKRWGDLKARAGAIVFAAKRCSQA